MTAVEERAAHVQTVYAPGEHPNPQLQRTWTMGCDCGDVAVGFPSRKRTEEYVEAHRRYHAGTNVAPYLAEQQTAETPARSSAARRSGRARAKADTNKAAIDRMNARCRAADACDLSGPVPLTEGNAAPAARTPGSGQEASTTMETTTPTMATPAPKTETAKPDTSTKALTLTQQHQQAVKDARKRGKRGKGKPITAQELLDYIVKVRKDNADAVNGTESSYAWWVLKYAFSQPKWNELWDLAGKGVTKAPESASPAPKAEAPKAAATSGSPAPAKATGTVKKQTPGAKARAAAKAEPKAAVAKPKAKAPAKAAEKQVTTNFKAEK